MLLWRPDESVRVYCNIKKRGAEAPQTHHHVKYLPIGNILAFLPNIYANLPDREFLNLANSCRTR